MPDDVTVPAPILRRLRTLAQDGQAPLIRWNESPRTMDAKAFEATRRHLTEIEEIIDQLLPTEP